jgi:hypothetical protein
MGVRDRWYVTTKDVFAEVKAESRQSILWASFL